MKKVVLICGSPRAKGNTMHVLTACAEAIKAQGVDAKIVSLAGKKIESCVACYACRDGSGRCVIKDDLNEIVAEVEGADGLIVGAPVYFGTARGDMMSLLQRLGMVSRSGKQFLKNMVGGPVAVARRGGSTVAIQEMLMFYFINGMIVVGADYWNILFGGIQEGSVQEDTEGMNNIKVFGSNVAEVIKKVR